jgi:hypothetical protein
MSAATYNIAIDQGSDFAVELQISEEGVPRVLTGYFARAHIRKTKTSGVVAAEFTCTITDALDGKLTMVMPNADTSALAYGSYFYDMEIYTLNDAAVTRMLQGEVVVTQEVTR